MGAYRAGRMGGAAQSRRLGSRGGRARHRDDRLGICPDAVPGNGCLGYAARAVCAVNVSPLLRELILHTISLGALDRNVPERAPLIGFLVDQLSALPLFRCDFPCRRIAPQSAPRHGCGRIPKIRARSNKCRNECRPAFRTLERLFQKETGMTFGKWRQQLRLLHARRLLAAGQPITAVALSVGYESAIAFIASFRHFFGTTPARYFR